jgi:hypothetical protein
MNVTLIGTVPRGHCLSALDEHQRRRLLAFVDRKDAIKCIKYVATFRNRYGYWPDCDLSRTVPVEVKPVENVKKRSIENIEKFFYMIDYNDSTVDELCAVYNLPLLLVHSFDYNPQAANQIQVMLSAQHLNCQPDMYRYTAKLNQLLNIDFGGSE